MNDVGEVLVNGDRVVMAINDRTVLLVPSRPVGKFTAHTAGSGQEFVKIDGALICVDGVETSASAKAFYQSGQFGVPPGIAGTLALRVKRGEISRCDFFTINGKAVLWRSGKEVGVDGKVTTKATAPPKSPAAIPEPDQRSHYEGSGDVEQSQQAFVTVTF
ncbi:hypothetical protein JOE11_000145 [Robbsia andropogonis]|uniref:hypothetical protein n=1 Tax=Robbsia andropogonis TaxID=28092 RepID=UPI003D1B1F6A